MRLKCKKRYSRRYASCTVFVENLVVVIVVVIVVDVDDVVVLLLGGVIAITLAGELYKVTSGTQLRKTEEHEVVGAALNVRVSKGAGLAFGGLAHLTAVLVHVVDGVGLTAGQPQGKNAQKSEAGGGATSATHYKLHIVTIQRNRLGQIAFANHFRGLLAAGKNTKSYSSEDERNSFHNLFLSVCF